MADGKKTAADVAKWMYDEVRKAGDLDQNAAAIIIYQEFGQEFTYFTDKGNVGIVEAVKKEFKKLHQGTVKYSSRKGVGRWYLA